jgi:hypothetical protein
MQMAPFQKSKIQRESGTTTNARSHPLADLEVICSSSLLLAVRHRQAYRQLGADLAPL